MTAGRKQKGSAVLSSSEKKLQLKAAKMGCREESRCRGGDRAVELEQRSVSNELC